MSCRTYAPLALSLLATSIVVSGVSSVSCRAAYLADPERWFALSRIALSQLNPGSSHSVDFDELATKQHAFSHTLLPAIYASRSEISDLTPFDNEGLAMIFQAAKVGIFTCWSEDGRLWEHEMTHNDTLFEEAGISGCIDNGLKLVPKTVRGALCAPQECEEVDIEELIAHYHAIMFHCGSLHDTRPRKVGLSEASELSHWSRLKLDFAIVGVDNCGTNSLRMNLQQHPDVAFTSEEAVDDFFTSIVERRTLPLRSQVEAFNARRPNTTRLWGLSDGGVFSAPLARLAASHVPSLRALLVVCDPLGRIEKEFMLYHYCGALASGDVPPGARPDRQRCAESIAEALEMPDFLRMQRLAPSLTEMRALFDGRLLVLHQELLRLAPRITYTGLATALGAWGPFPPGTSFRRYNSRRGHRTDLCKDVALVERFKQVLSEDYDGVAQALLLSGNEVPDRLHLRQSRCDRPEELIEADPEFRCGTYDWACGY